MTALEFGLDPNLYTEAETNMELDEHAISPYTKKGFKRQNKVYIDDVNKPRND